MTISYWEEILMLRSLLAWTGRQPRLMTPKPLRSYSILCSKWPFVMPGASSTPPSGISLTSRTYTKRPLGLISF